MRLGKFVVPGIGNHAAEDALEPDDDHDPQRWGYRAGLEHAVQLLAQPYAGRDGWREEWQA